MIDADIDAPEPFAELDDAKLIERIRQLPPEIGTMLMAVGVLGVALPGVVGLPALVAGGLVLWPEGFSRVDSWLERRSPRLHHVGMRKIGRFLDDLEARYPTPQGPDPT